MYDKLSVKKAPLSLIAPQFETPLPPLQPAVFPPALREPPPPAGAYTCPPLLSST
jgi:intraflagellar transport protein 52